MRICDAACSSARPRANAWLRIPERGQLLLPHGSGGPAAPAARPTFAWSRRARSAFAGQCPFPRWLLRKAVSSEVFIDPGSAMAPPLSASTTSSASTTEAPAAATAIGRTPHVACVRNSEESHAVWRTSPRARATRDNHGELQPRAVPRRRAVRARERRRCGHPDAGSASAEPRPV